MKELMNSLHTLEDIEKAKNQKNTVILTFSAEWCPDCQFIKPFMPKLIDEFKDYDFYYIDRDECIDAAKELMIMGIPSFVAFKEGKELGRFVSKLRKTETEIRNFLTTVK